MKNLKEDKNRRCCLNINDALNFVSKIFPLEKFSYVDHFI